MDVAGVEYDSRRVGRGDVFVAMRGGVADGNRFVEGAIAQGAVGVVTDSREVFERLRVGACGVGCCAGGAGAAWAGGVECDFLWASGAEAEAECGDRHEWEDDYGVFAGADVAECGAEVRAVGTIETHVGDEVRESPHTTPESRDVLEIFADGVKAGATEAVMEMSSHALEQERVWGLPVDVAMFTNLTQDHLDYHGTMEKYFAAKARLFAGVGAAPPRVAVINVDDACGCAAGWDGWGFFGDDVWVGGWGVSAEVCDCVRAIRVL